MKNIKIFIGVLTVMVFVLIASDCLALQDVKAPDALTVIHSRKSVRHFTGQPVSREDLDKILRAGMAAPTAVGRQPWSFVVVTDRKTLNTLKDGLPYAKMLDKAGAAIIVCAIPEKAYEKRVEFAVIDSTCAGENILLAAEAMGLGAVWTAAYPYKDRMDVVRKTLSIPDDIIPLNVIPIGHPAGVDKPKNKYNPENIHWERW
ncbi:MAG: FMN reductase (NADPH) [Syntrophorhabdus sp. PtaU1.Bin058]|nr:MAG: FMN reductase (NADPH) [Syntrophorhabdus sp. PtaU1.Bin058]